MKENKTERIVARITPTERQEIDKYISLLKNNGINKSMSDVITLGIDQLFYRELENDKQNHTEWKLDKRDTFLIKYDPEAQFLNEDIEEFIKELIPNLKEDYKDNNSKLNILSIISEVLEQMVVQNEMKEQAVAKYIKELEAKVVSSMREKILLKLDKLGEDLE